MQLIRRIPHQKPLKLANTGQLRQTVLIGKDRDFGRQFWMYRVPDRLAGQPDGSAMALLKYQVEVFDDGKGAKFAPKSEPALLSARNSKAEALCTVAFVPDQVTPSKCSKLHRPARCHYQRQQVCIIV